MYSIMVYKGSRAPKEEAYGTREKADHGLAKLAKRYDGQDVQMEMLDENYAVIRTHDCLHHA